MKRVLAVLSGCIVGVLVLFLVESINYFVHPTPENINLKDPEQLKQLAESVPTLAYAILLLAGFLGAFLGGITATAIMGTNQKIEALIVGGVLTALGVLNLLQIPHPIWFIIAGLFIYFVGAYAGFRIYSKFKKNDQKS